MSDVYEEIGKDLAEYFKERREDFLIFYLNNFHRRLNKKSWIRREKIKKFTKPHRNHCDPKNHSELFLKQTGVEYFNTIDKVCDEVGIIKELEKYNTILDEEITSVEQKKEHKILSRKIDELLLQAYIRLREIGYTKFDLTI